MSSPLHMSVSFFPIAVYLLSWSISEKESESEWVMGCEVTSEKSSRSKKLTSVHVGSLQGIKHWLVDLDLESSLVDS